jgi:1-acyl-sn-glycerol-3-phosphate acyltransferase
MSGLIRVFKRLYFAGVYYLTWTVFGTVSLGLNLVCLVLLVMPARERWGTVVRETIRRLFAAWVRWLHACKIIVVTWDFAEGAKLTKPAVYVANHPSLVDATLILARIPDAVCIMKPSLMRNPFLASAAIMAGYIPGDHGVDLVRAAAQKAAAGHSLLIFPEGTRTDIGRTINPLKAGFALIARRAQVPVQTLLVRNSGEFLPRGRPWWYIPNMPVYVHIEVKPAALSDAGAPARDWVKGVQTQWTGWLANSR